MTLKLPLLKRSLDGSGETVVLLAFLNMCACGDQETWVFWRENVGWGVQWEESKHFKNIL